MKDKNLNRHSVRKSVRRAPSRTTSVRSSRRKSVRKSSRRKSSRRKSVRKSSVRKSSVRRKSVRKSSSRSSSRFSMPSNTKNIQSMSWLEYGEDIKHEIQIPTNVYEKFFETYESISNKDDDSSSSFLKVKVKKHKNPKKDYVFTNVSANNFNKVILPQWAIEGLDLLEDNGDLGTVDIEFVRTNVPKAKYVVLQPHNEEYKSWDDVEDMLTPAFLQSRIVNKDEIFTVYGVNFTVKKVEEELGDKTRRNIPYGMLNDVDLEPEIIDSVEETERKKHEKQRRRQERKTEKQRRQDEKQRKRNMFDQDLRNRLRDIDLRHSEAISQYIENERKRVGRLQLSQKELERKAIKDNEMLDKIDRKFNLEREAVKNLEYQDEHNSWNGREDESEDTDDTAEHEHVREREPEHDREQVKRALLEQIKKDRLLAKKELKEERELKIQAIEKHYEDKILSLQKLKRRYVKNLTEKELDREQKEINDINDKKEKEIKKLNNEYVEKLSEFVDVADESDFENEDEDAGEGGGWDDAEFDDEWN